MKQTGMVLLLALILGAVILPWKVCAREPRTVRIGFFPMEGFHTYTETHGYDGLDIAYLERLCVYTGWQIECVECDSWDDALQKLQEREVDLVGSAQYSAGRAEIYDYAAVSSGYTYGCLFVEPDSDLAFEDFDRMRDMTFGVVASYIRKDEFLDYLDRNGISDPHIREYDTTRQMQDALKAGEVDIAVHTLTEIWERQCLVGKFAYAPYYYITWKGNEELLNELNMGIEDLNMDTPTLEQDLMNAYYGHRRENFAAEELQFINSGKTIRIGFYQDTKPLAYVNDSGECDGIYIRILQTAAERSGVSMEFCPLERKEYWKDLLTQGKIDFYVGASSAQLVRDSNIALTDTFMDYNAVIISRNNHDMSADNVTMVLTNGRAYWAEELQVKGAVLYRDSARACLDALESDEADITLMNTIEFNYQSKNERFSNLIEWDNYRYQSDAALAALSTTEPVTLDVMNKALGLIEEDEKKDIINLYMNIPYVDYEFADYLYQSKDLVIIFGIALALFVAFGCVISRLQRESYQMLENKNKELQTAIDEAERANKAKTEFLSHMSHDIRTPINGIMGMLNIAEKNPLDADRQEDCRKKIKTSAEHLLSLINDVLDINKMESGNVEFAREVFNLRELLRNCAVIVGGQASARGVKLTTEFEEPELLRHELYIGSPLHIKQILINIAGNAVKYNKPDGSVDLRCYEISEENGTARICFEVSDTGIGMSKEYMEHIFEPFTQEDSGARTTYQGTGLGMTITKKLVDSMGGTIEIESETGLGSVFTVVLPLVIAQAEDSKAEEEKAPAEKRERGGVDQIRGKHALLVEDNELNQEIACYMLEENGLEVTLAANGKEAVDLFRESAPGTYQIVFMDVMMPVMNGHDAAKAIRNLDRPDAATVPIVAMTANAFAEDVQAARDAGMNEHIAKPLEPDMIQKILQHFLGEHTTPDESI